MKSRNAIAPLAGGGVTRNPGSPTKKSPAKKILEEVMKMNFVKVCFLKVQDFLFNSKVNSSRVYL